MSLFKKAVKTKEPGKAAIIGPAGSGKTFSALSIAKGLGSKVALIDSEHGTARKYADQFDFDHLVLTTFSPENYIAALKAAEAEGYDVVIVDSLSHAWAGKGGVLEFVDEEKRKSRTGDAFSDGWGKGTKKHNSLVEALQACRIHLVVTMRSKMEYVKEDDPNRPGKTRVRKVGMQPIQRDGLEYEFDIVGDLDQSNTLTLSKSRCPAIPNDAVIEKPGEEFGATFRKWLEVGAPAPEVKPEEPKPEPVAEKPKPEGPKAGNGLRGRMLGLARENGLVKGNDTSDLKQWLSAALGRPIESSKDMTDEECQKAVEALEAPAVEEQPEPAETSAA